MSLRNRNIVIILCLTMLGVAFIADSPADILKGLIAIIKSPDILLTDYVEIGGVGATFVNASLMGFINLYLLKKTETEVDGLALAALLTIVGFSFIGKNIFNFWPIYMGGLLYTRFKGIHFNTIIKTLMFATTLSPVVSELSFGTQLMFPFGLILGISLGLIIGFIIVPISARTYKTHEGFSLYNVGLSGGLIGTIIFSLLRSFDILVDVQDIISVDYHYLLSSFIIVFSLILILYGIVGFGTNVSDYRLLLKESGLNPHEFSNQKYKGAMYINMGLVGLISLSYALVLGATLNGPIVAAIFTVMGFGAYGKHPANIVPVLLGVFLAANIKIWDVGSTHVIIASLFGTTLAPISGVFGPVIGVVAGFLHLSTAMNVGVIHGGTNLYNNGFAGGLVSIIMVSVLVDVSDKAPKFMKDRRNKTISNQDEEIL